jgi:hypothetical protein
VTLSLNANIADHFIMKKSFQVLAIVVGFSLHLPLHAQGTFQNLAFEASTVPPLANGQSGGSVLMSAAFPNWTGYWGTNVAPSAFHNDLSIGGVSISILGPSNSVILEGNFTATLQAGGLFSSLPVYPASLAQTGTLPSGIHSIMFYSAFTRPEITFNGQVIPIGLVGFGVSGTGTAYEILGGDISAFAGQNGELRFTSYASQGQFGSLTYLDNIFFSNQPIPEPSVFGLLGFVALLLGLRTHARA